MKAEITGYVVAYDLPSENHLQFSGQHVDFRTGEIKRVKESAKNREKRIKARSFVMAKRVKATGLLYSLGLPSTQSVLLVSKDRGKHVDQVVEDVKKIYGEVNKILEKQGYYSIGKPLIKKVPIVETQFLTFRELAERQVKEKLDKQIEKFAGVMTKIDEVTEEAKRKALRYRVSDQERSLTKVERLAKELGIDVSNEVALLSSLIGEAIQKLEAI